MSVCPVRVKCSIVLMSNVKSYAGCVFGGYTKCKREFVGGEN